MTNDTRKFSAEEIADWNCVTRLQWDQCDYKEICERLLQACDIIYYLQSQNAEYKLALQRIACCNKIVYGHVVDIAERALKYQS